MSTEQEEQKGFRVTDKRLSSKSDEEKRRIISQVQPRAEQEPDPAGFTPNQQSSGPLPEVDFSALVFSLSTQAVIQLGELDDPAAKKKGQNLPQAKQTIDILSMLKEKTQGNLTAEEQSLLDNLLYDLRMRFVKISK